VVLGQPTKRFADRRIFGHVISLAPFKTTSVRCDLNIATEGYPGPCGVAGIGFAQPIAINCQLQVMVSFLGSEAKRQALRSFGCGGLRP
jgi:hypothetical protein